MSDFLLPIAVNIAGWGFALYLGVIAVGLFWFRHWLKVIEKSEADDDE